jgi:hypothetical protein
MNCTTGYFCSHQVLSRGAFCSCRNSGVDLEDRRPSMRFSTASTASLSGAPMQPAFMARTVCPVQEHHHVLLAGGT